MKLCYSVQIQLSYLIFICRGKGISLRTATHFRSSLLSLRKIASYAINASAVRRLGGNTQKYPSKLKEN